MRSRSTLMTVSTDAAPVYVTLGLPHETRVWQHDWPLVIENFVAAARRHRFKLIFFDNVYPYGPSPLRVLTAILLPFSMMTVLVEWQREIRIGAGLIVVALGLYLMINRRHPRFLARIPPSRLALWSFLVAMAHGAGLMLVPIYLGICATPNLDAGHQAATVLMQGNVVTALYVASAHTLAMSLAGGVIAAAVYFWLGLRFLSQSWFNLDLVWASSLVLVGGISL